MLKGWTLKILSAQAVVPFQAGLWGIAGAGIQYMQLKATEDYETSLDGEKSSGPAQRTLQGKGMWQSFYVFYWSIKSSLLS